MSRHRGSAPHPSTGTSSGSLVVREQHALSGDEGEQAVRVLQAAATSARVLNLIEKLDRQPRLDRLDPVGLGAEGRVVANARHHPSQEVGCEVQLPDLVVVLQRPVLPGHGDPLQVLGLRSHPSAHPRGGRGERPRRGAAERRATTCLEKLTPERSAARAALAAPPAVPPSLLVPLREQPYAWRIHHMPLKSPWSLALILRHSLDRTFAPAITPA